MKNKALGISLLIIFAGLVVVYYNFNPASSHSFFPSCPTYSILGFYCPGCGTQRTIYYLLHGELSNAMRYNPLFVIFLPLSIALIIHYLIPRFTHAYWDFKLIRNNYFLYFLFAIIVLYFIVRNIPLAVFDILRPPDKAL